MVIATLLLICSIPQMDGTAKVVKDSPAVVSDSATKDSTLVAAALPSAPAPKVKTEAESFTPNAAAQPFQPIKPVFTRPRETPRQRKIWYGLALAGHSGAAFDAWSTHRAVAGGYGQEANPMLRPFANSNAIYAATQVSPVFMDFLGKRGCRRPRGRACPLHQARTTSALCTKSSLNPPAKSVPVTNSPGRFCFWPGRVCAPLKNTGYFPTTTITNEPGFILPRRSPGAGGSKSAAGRKML